VYKEELSDSLGLDHINDQIIRLDNDQRAELEDILDNIIKGKKVRITIED
jgi:hypothetical protein